jgi:hypothetical protein
LAARAAASIQKELGVPVETVVGDVGEFTVWVNGQKVLAKGFLVLPSEKKIIAAIRKSVPASS